MRWRCRAVGPEPAPVYDQDLAHRLFSVVTASRQSRMNQLIQACRTFFVGHQEEGLAVVSRLAAAARQYFRFGSSRASFPSVVASHQRRPVDERAGRWRLRCCFPAEIGPGHGGAFGEADHFGAPRGLPISRPAAPVRVGRDGEQHGFKGQVERRTEGLCPGTATRRYGPGKRSLSVACHDAGPKRSGQGGEIGTLEGPLQNGPASPNPPGHRPAVNSSAGSSSEFAIARALVQQACAGAGRRTNRNLDSARTGEYWACCAADREHGPDLRPGDPRSGGRPNLRQGHPDADGWSGTEER